jgi:hypothetical protein
MKNILVLLMALLCLLTRAQTYTIGITNVTGANFISCKNASVNLVVTNNLPSPVTYSWAGPSTLSGTNVMIGTPGNYTVSASSGTLVISATYSISTYTVAPSISIAQPTQTLACNGSPAQMPILVNPQPTLSGSPGVALSHIITSNLGSSYAVNGNSSFLYSGYAPGNYSVVTTNTINGCSTSATFTITGTGFPTFSLQSPQNFTIGCGTHSVAILNIMNANTTPTPGGVIGYTLLAPGSPSTPNVGIQSSYTIAVPGSYTANVKDLSSGCISSVPVNIVLNANGPVINVIAPTMVLTCSSPSVQLQALSPQSGVTYTWAFGVTSQTGNVIAAYSNTAAPTLTALGNYIVTAKDTSSKCISQTTVQILQNLFPPKPLISNGGQPALTCSTPSIILTNQSSSSIPASAFPNNLPVIGYNWQGPSPLPVVSVSTTYTATVPGVYTMTAQDLNNGCMSTTVIAINDNRTYPVVNNPNAPPVYCINFTPTVILTPIITSPTINLNYSWGGPGASTITGAQSMTLSATAIGIYTITVKNIQNGCTSLGTFTVAFCDGITAARQNEKVTVFPNPTKDRILLSGMNENNISLISIYELNGALVKKEQTNKHAVEIDLSDISKGVYFVTVRQNETLYGPYKILKE